MLRISNLPVPLSATDADLLKAAVGALGVPQSEIISCSLARRAVDARDKHAVRWVVSLDVAGRWSAAREEALLRRGGQISRIEPYRPPIVARVRRPVVPPLVVGAGPAGLFAALRLAQAGWKPIVWERGKPVELRSKDAKIFQAGGALNPESNIQFGEGGAGTFSDGKLTTGIKDPRREEVLRTFAECGAPDEILVSAKPHVGTDRLEEVVRRLREKLISLGADVRFGSRLTGLSVRAGRVHAVRGARTFTADESMADVAMPETIELGVNHVLLAVGHSARDTLCMLAECNVALQPKPFAVGVRIEHRQSWLDKTQYGAYSGHPALGAADYKLAAHLGDGADVYTFCMCPGGTVVAAASEQGGVVVNGMSRYARDGVNANSALLVAVSEDRFADRPLAGLDFQRGLEEAAFRVGGGDFTAPTQLVGDFLARRASRMPGGVLPTYPRGVAWGSLDECLPRWLADSLRRGLMRLDRMLPGFAQADAVMTAVESRSSSPVRIARDEMYQTSVQGLYAAGEGAGWAGGIVSSAVDGLRAAEAMLAGAEDHRI